MKKKMAHLSCCCFSTVTVHCETVLGHASAGIIQLYRGYIIVINPLGDFGVYPKGSGYDNHLESLTKIPSSHLYEKKDGAFELTSLPPHPHVLLAFK